jgi:hypothetical protein
MPFYLWTLACIAIVSLGAWIWAGDEVTWQGERTVYTADCVGGTWKAGLCDGRVVQGARYRFRVLKNRKEVLFWTLGASTPSSKFSDCAIVDGRNWQCRPEADAAKTITLQMQHGAPVQTPQAGTLPYHAVPKWRWWLLGAGVSFGLT